MVFVWSYNCLKMTITGISIQSQIPKGALEAATVNAGSPQTVCADASVVQLAGTFGGSATSVLWSTVEDRGYTGDGTFLDPTDPNTTYTCGPGDIINGSVTLGLTTNNPPGFEFGPATDIVVITIDAPATVFVALQGGGTNISPEGSMTSGAVGGSATMATWSTSGDGTFGNVNTLVTMYTPGPGDISAGSVTLTLTTDDPTGPCTLKFDSETYTVS